jgi:hypothetical protein
MIEIEIQPKEIDFAGNPLAFSVIGGNYIISNGVYSYLQLTKNGALVGGQSFILTFLGYELTFLIGSGSTDTGLYIPAGATRDEMYAYMCYNYLLTKYFDVTTVSHDKIKITSKNIGASYTIASDITGCPALTKTEAAGVDPSVEPNFKIMFQPFYKSRFMVSYQNLPEQFADVDNEGVSLIHVNELMKHFFDTIELPDFNTGFLKISYETLYRYYFNFAENYGEEPSVKRLYASDVLHILNGRLPFDKFPGHDFIGELQSTMKFLTNRTQPVETYKPAQQFLYWINTTGETINEIGIFVRAWRKAVPLVPFVMVRDWLTNVEPYDVIITPAGHDQLLIGTLGDCWKYEVFISQIFEGTPPEPISESFQFEIIPQKAIHKQLLIKNDFGVYETLIIEKVSNKLELKNKLIEKSLEYDYQLPDGEIVPVTESSANKFTARTGTMKKVDAIHLAELLSNNDAYIVAEIQYVPIVIEAGTVELVDENDDVFSVKFEYRYTINGILSPEA